MIFLFCYLELSRNIATLTGHTSYVWTLVELQNGDFISGSGDKTIKVWDMKTRTCIATLTGHTSTVNALVELQNGDVISCSSDNTIKVWDMKTRTCIATLLHTTYYTSYPFYIFLNIFKSIFAHFTLYLLFFLFKNFSF